MMASTKIDISTDSSSVTQNQIASSQPNNPLSRKLNKILETRLDSDKVSRSFLLACQHHYQHSRDTRRVQCILTLCSYYIGVLTTNKQLLDRLCGQRYQKTTLQRFFSFSFGQDLRSSFDKAIFCLNSCNLVVKTSLVTYNLFLFFKNQPMIF